MIVDTNRQLHDTQLGGFHTLLDNVNDGLNNSQTAFTNFNIRFGHNVQQRQQYIEQCQDMLNMLNITLERTETINKSPTTELFSSLLEQFVAQLSEQLEQLVDVLENISVCLRSLLERVLDNRGHRRDLYKPAA